MSKETHSTARTPEYRAWVSMRQRCNNPRDAAYVHYGARGISVCPGWSDFRVFLKDVGCRPSPEHSIDRFPDNNGNYEPGNVRWATWTEQQNNTRKSIKVEFEGRMVSFTELSQMSGVNRATIIARHKRGWTGALLMEGAAFGRRLVAPNSSHAGFSGGARLVKVTAPDGALMTVLQISTKYDIPTGRLRDRIRRGLTFAEIISPHVFVSDPAPHPE